MTRLAAAAARVVSADWAQLLLTAEVRSRLGEPDDAAPRPSREVTDCARAALETGGPVVRPDLLVLPLTGPLPAPGVLCVGSSTPRSWSADDLSRAGALAAMAGEQLDLLLTAEQHRTEREQLELALTAARVGTFVWDVRTGTIAWDERLEAIAGYEPGRPPGEVEGFYGQLHPDDLAAVRKTLHEAAEACGEFSAEYRVLRPEGCPRWVAARGRALPGPDGRAERVVGTVQDVTARRTAKDDAERILESMAAGFLAVNHDWTIAVLNAEGERILDRDRDDVLGRQLWEVFPGAEGLEFGRRFRTAMSTGQEERFEEHYPHLDSWVDVRAVPSPHGLGVYFLDITARYEAQQRSEAATARAELLSEVSARVAATLDPLAMVAELPRLVVPALGDWCIVTVQEEDGSLRDLGCWHDDEALRPLVQRYAALRGPALRGSPYVGRALATAETVLIEHDATARITPVLGDGPAAQTLRRLGPEQVVLLPLQAHGRITGLLNVFGGPGRSILDPENLSTLTEVAQRAGVALDNARLYGQQRSLAEGLQRGLLTDPPPVDGLDIAVRYQPAASAAQVGGDWYDVFVQPRGDAVLVIGDVVGHDTEAAAAMAQVRGLLRGIAYRTGGSPAEVLTGLDETMRGLQVDTTATAVVARLERTEHEVAHGTARLRWSNAGHPPPMLVTPDGDVQVLATDSPGLLLGIRPSTLRADCEQVLRTGSTVLLYTDGLVEQRRQTLDDGLALLEAALRDLAGWPLEELCDELLRRLLPGCPEDDVAIVAVRLLG